ncbi:LLM class flavin-dependent oxidoreductase [Flindersiella endophytica]
MPSADLKLGVTLPADHDQLLARVQHAEDLGLESVWFPDVLVGDGTPMLEPIVGLAAAAAATERVLLGFSTLVPPIRPLALLSAQILSLQHVSRNRLMLGVGSGGFFGAPFWQATGVPPRQRGRLTDAALAMLPDLLAGNPTTLGGTDALTLAPPAKSPPVLVGGNSDVAIRRTVRFGDSWFPSLITPRTLAGRIEDLRDAAAAAGRAVPATTVGGHVRIGAEDPVARAGFVHAMIEGYGLPAEEAEQVPIDGDPARVAERIAEYAEIGVERMVLSLDGDDWMRQAELLADAQALSR